MKKDEVTTMLRSAVSNAAPDVLDNVLHACDHEKGKVIYMEKKKNSTTRLIGPPPIPRKDDIIPRKMPIKMHTTALSTL